MAWKRVLLRGLRGLLAILIIFDLLPLLQSRRHGWPVILSGQPPGDGVMQISVARVPLSAVDFVIAALLVSLEIAVVYGNWRIGRAG